MKSAVVLLALVSVGLTAPRPRKIFHEHFEDFMTVIFNEVGDELTQLTEHYSEFEEFWRGVDYISSANFRALLAEMEALPEFNAVIEFLERDNIDILYFIDRFHEMLDGSAPTRSARQALSGRDLNAYITDVTSTFPRANLRALYEQKVAEDLEFKATMDNLNSEEWQAVFGELWASDDFQKEVKAFGENGLSIDLVLQEIKAIFGQND